MHDIRDLESRGVVTVGIATTEFIDAAAIENKHLGFEPAVVFVDHPIQVRTQEEIRALADQALDSIVAAVSALG